MELWIWDVVSGDRDPPNNTRKQTKLAKDKAKAAWIIKFNVSNAFFFWIKNDNNPETCWNTLQETSSQTGQDVVYALFSEVVQYPTTRKVKGLTRKTIIKHYLVEITSIIDRLLAAVEEGHDIWDDMKLILFFKSLSQEFDQQKAYILASQNITLRKIATSFASNEVQILRNHATKLEIEEIAMTARIKQRWSKSVIAGKVKVTSATFIEDVEY